MLKLLQNKQDQTGETTDSLLSLLRPLADPRLLQEQVVHVHKKGTKVVVCNILVLLGDSYNVGVPSASEIGLSRLNHGAPSSAKNNLLLSSEL